MSKRLVTAEWALAALLLVAAGGCGGEGGEATTLVTSPGTTAGTTAAPTTVAVPTSGTTSPPTSGSTLPPTSTTMPPAPWMRVPADEGVFGGPGDQGMEGVAAWATGFVAVGRDSSGGDEDAAVWLSPDGTSWERVPHDEAVFGGAGDQRMVAVAAGGPGLVAVGADFHGYEEGNAAVWTSADGVAWERHDPQDPGLGGIGYQGMRDVVALGAQLVAVGEDGSGGDRDAAVWVSGDGLVWNRVPHEESRFGGPDEQGMFDVVAGGPGLVAVGWDSGILPPVAAVWLSADGLEWARVTPDAAAFAEVLGLAMWGVTPGGPGLVAVGAGCGDGSDACAWASGDGLSWERAPADVAVLGGGEGQGAWGVVAVDGELIGVGSDFAGGDGDAVVWVSSDGLGWSRSPEGVAVFGGPGDQILKSVARGGPGLVAVGYDITGDADAAVWLRPAG